MYLYMYMSEHATHLVHCNCTWCTTTCATIMYYNATYAQCKNDYFLWPVWFDFWNLLNEPCIYLLTDNMHWSICTCMFKHVYAHIHMHSLCMCNVHVHECLALELVVIHFVSMKYKYIYVYDMIIFQLSDNICTQIMDSFLIVP